MKIGLVFLLAAAYLAAPAFFSPATGHSWYPIACCSKRDCQPIPADAVEELGGGRWHVRYINQDGNAVDAIAEGSTVKPSQDGGFHACAPLGVKGVVVDRLYCFFPPSNS